MRKCHIEQQREAGFTLVEVLVATAIFAIGIMGVATMISRSTIQDARAYHTARASMVIEEFFENATRKQYVPGEFNNMTNASQNVTLDGVVYSMNCILTASTPLEGCSLMNCTVNWNNKGLPAGTRYVYVYARKY